MSKSKRNGTRVIGRARLSYANIWHPTKGKFDSPDQEPKYRTDLLIPKTDTEFYNHLIEAVEEAYVLGESKFGKGFTAKAKANPLAPFIKDGDEKCGNDPTDPRYGHWVVSASSKNRPGIVGRDREPLTNEEDLVSGYYVNVSVNAYPYGYMRKGVAWGLGNIQKVIGRPEDRLIGGPSARDEFDDIQDEDDDEDYGF